MPPPRHSDRGSDSPAPPASHRGNLSRRSLVRLVDDAVAEQCRPTYGSDPDAHLTILQVRRPAELDTLVVSRIAAQPSAIPRRFDEHGGGRTNEPPGKRRTF